MLGPGVSSDSIWTAFSTHATATIRLPKYQVKIAWTRVDDVTSWATVGTSLVGGIHIVAGSSSVPNIVSADTFRYFDETENTLQIEYDRSLIEPLGGFSMALADVLLNNTTKRFTPTINATIGTAIKPNRPIKLFVGFLVKGQTKLIPIIEGLTLYPKENKQNRTVAITCYDYMKFLNEYPLETTIYQNQRSDQIITDILTTIGLGTSTYSLDTGLNSIGFAWFEKGMTAGDRIRKICEAEEAIFYQDEEGILRFENRRHFSVAPHSSNVWTVNPDDILAWEYDDSTPIINRCIVKAKPRSVQASAEIWRDGITEEVSPGASVIIWASFEDPVTGVTTPAATTDYLANSASDGSGTNLTANVSIAISAFTKAAKLTITNSSGVTAYITMLRLRGTPATITSEIEELYQDNDSINVYDEKQLIIENDFIDSKSFAYYLAGAIVRKYKDPRKRIVCTIRGLPHLQLRDRIRVKDQDTNAYTNYRVMRINGVLTIDGGFIQRLYLREVVTSEADSWAIVGTTTVASTTELVGQ